MCFMNLMKMNFSETNHQELWLRDCSMTNDQLQEIVEFLRDNEIFLRLIFKMDPSSSIDISEFEDLRADLTEIYVPSLTHLTKCQRNCSKFTEIVL